MCKMRLKYASTSEFVSKHMLYFLDLRKLTTVSHLIILLGKRKGPERPKLIQEIKALLRGLQ